MTGTLNFQTTKPLTQTKHLKKKHTISLSFVLPGICDPYNSPQCTLKNSFVECDLEEFKCPRLNNTGVRQIDMAFLETTIPATETNYYCMTFDLPSDQDYHVIATEPIMDNMEVLHHILVYACEDENSANISRPQACGMEAEGECGSIIGLWTVGNPGVCFADNIGFRFGQTAFKKVKLEVRWWG
ncbi:DBH-like monooxygenase protein 1 [Elysia marginata]|uniref:DBH-like monooxygenase protein 1 n=1 Tax=Elysia marginata TaxID=1093978 RepID=A0AAV4JQI5_9GAST|nr:DBH-like monooxygenase protein 1 [Elysia marginata]